MMLLAAAPVMLAAQASQPAAKSGTLAKARPHKKKPAAAVVPAPLPAQELPPVPATLMNSPAVKPSVTLEGGLLTIDAPNSSLSDVLSGVRKVTGAVLEGPTPSERIVIKLGPGSPEQVLNALLQGTAYDYVIVGAPGAPQNVTRLVLSTPRRPGEGGDEPETPAGPQAAGPPHQRPAPGEEAAAEEENPPEYPSEEQILQSQQPEAQRQPEPPPQQQNNQQKTPEQLFRELQQMSQPPSQDQQH